MQKLNTKVLDKIVKNTIVAVQNSKDQIYDIYQAAGSELTNIRKDLEQVKQETADAIVIVDKLEKKDRLARNRLMEVNRDFNLYTEENIKEAYTNAKDLQINLALARQREITLRTRRDELELRLRNLEATVGKAEKLVTQIGVVLGYLNDAMGGVEDQQNSLQQAQIFGAKIIKAQEEERRRVAREIHDGPAQAMANVVFRAEVCEHLIDRDSERVKQELKDLREQVLMCLRETRHIIFDLRPMALDDLGLAAAVKRLADTLQDRCGIATEVRIIGDERPLDAHVSIGVFRVVQEALNNIEKHAVANKATVALEFHQHKLTGIITDDGRGFDPGQCLGNGESFGIMGMQERINLLNGELIIKSEPGNGTRITFQAPLKNDLANRPVN